MKRTVRLRESELRRMIAESVRRVLNEGNKINNKKGYFGRMRDDNGEEHLTPLSSYAKKDANHHISNDWTEFDDAAFKHIDREYQDDSMDYGGKNPNRDLIYNVAKLGIPMKLAWKLSPKTLYDVMRQLSK